MISAYDAIQQVNAMFSALKKRQQVPSDVAQQPFVWPESCPSADKWQCPACGRALFQESCCTVSRSEEQRRDR